MDAALLFALVMPGFFARLAKHHGGPRARRLDQHRATTFLRCCCVLVTASGLPNCAPWLLTYTEPVNTSFPSLNKKKKIIAI